MAKIEQPIGNYEIITSDDAEKLLEELLEEEKKQEEDIRNANKKALEEKLMEACKNDNLDEVKELIEKNNLNPREIVDSENRTLLHYAAQTKNLKLIKYLCEEQKLDSNAEDINGKKAVDYCGSISGLISGSIEYLKNMQKLQLIECCRLESKLVNICKNGNLKQLKNTVKENLANNECIFNRAIVACEQKMLKHASINGNLDLVKYLCEKLLVDPKEQDKFGKTSIHHAAKGGNLDVIKYLHEEQKVDLNIANLFDETPFEIVCKNGNFDNVKYFCEKLNIKDKDLFIISNYINNLNNSENSNKMLNYLDEKGFRLQENKNINRNLKNTINLLISSQRALENLDKLQQIQQSY